MAEQFTATNKKTGERIKLVNGEWVPINPIGKMETLGRNALGQMYEGTQNLLQSGANAVVNAGNDLLNVPIRWQNAINNMDPRYLSDSSRFVQDGNAPPPIGNLNPIPNVTLPRSGEENLFAAAQMAGEGAAALRTGDFGQFSPNPAEQQRNVMAQAERQNPITSQVGDILGTAMLVTSGRQPSSQFSNYRELARQTMLQRGGRGFMGAGPKANSRGALNFSKKVSEAFSNSSAARYLSAKYPRILESGVEGAAVGIIENGDPAEVAGFAAGTQAAGSFALSSLNELSGNRSLVSKFGRLGGAAAGLAVGIEALKFFTPGGDNLSPSEVADSFTDSLTKIFLTMGLGASFGLAGMGRVATRAKAPLDAATSFTDALTSMPRVATFSVINKLVEDPRAEPILKKLAEEPTYFGIEAGRRIERAIFNPDVDFSETIDSLSGNKEFQEAFEGL